MTLEHRIRALIAALLVGSLTGWIPPATAETQEPTLLQRLRNLLGIVQPMAAGGSRSSGTQVCLISPWIQKQNNPALITESRPILHTKDPLNEVTIERNGIPVWQRLASSTQPVLTPITWPHELDPVEPGERIVLILRALQAPAAERVRITLQGASHERMKTHEAKLKHLKQNKGQQTLLITEALDENNEELVIALLENSRHTSDRGNLLPILQNQPCQKPDSKKRNEEINNDHATGNLRTSHIPCRYATTSQSTTPTLQAHPYRLLLENGGSF